jgi:hypothetical protein
MANLNDRIQRNKKIKSIKVELVKNWHTRHQISEIIDVVIGQRLDRRLADFSDEDVVTIEQSATYEVWTKREADHIIRMHMQGREHVRKVVYDDGTEDWPNASLP